MRRIVKAREDDADTIAELETEVNTGVYRPFGLSREEIRLVEETR